MSLSVVRAVQTAISLTDLSADARKVVVGEGGKPKVVRRARIDAIIEMEDSSMKEGGRGGEAEGGEMQGEFQCAEVPVVVEGRVKRNQLRNIVRVQGYGDGLNHVRGGERCRGWG